MTSLNNYEHIRCMQYASTKKQVMLYVPPCPLVIKDVCKITLRALMKTTETRTHLHIHESDMEYFLTAHLSLHCSQMYTLPYYNINIIYAYVLNAFCYFKMQIVSRTLQCRAI